MQNNERQRYIGLSLAERMSYDSLSNRLAQLMSIYNITWAKLSKSLDVQMSQIYKWEKGESRITPQKVFALSALLETSAYGLMGIPEPKALMCLREPDLTPPPYWEPVIDPDYLSMSLLERGKYKFPHRNLQSLRLAAEKTGRQMAKYFGVSDSCYAAWERGVSTPNISQAFAIASAYGVTVNQLLGIPDDKLLRKSLSSVNVPLPQKEQAPVDNSFAVNALGQEWADALSLPILENTKNKLLAQYEYENKTDIPASLKTPPPERLFRALRLTPPSQVKVVMMTTGFPKTRYGESDWLALSNSEAKPGNYRNLLGMLFRTYCEDLELPIPPSGDLSLWAKRGVLLFPMFPLAQTKDRYDMSSRLMKFSIELVRYLSTSAQPVVFILIGSKVAVRMTHLIDLNAQSNRLIKWKVPRRDNDYTNTKLFSATNKALIEMGATPVNFDLGT